MHKSPISGTECYTEPIRAVSHKREHEEVCLKCENVKSSAKSQYRRAINRASETQSQYRRAWVLNYQDGCCEPAYAHWSAMKHATAIQWHAAGTSPLERDEIAAGVKKI